MLQASKTLQLHVLSDFYYNSSEMFLNLVKMYHVFSSKSQPYKITKLIDSWDRFLVSQWFS